MTTETKIDHAVQNAQGWLESIREMVAALDNGGTIDGDEYTADSARERIEESVLSVEVRTDWHSVGANDQKPTHYRILLSTGGPALQLVGELSEHGEPENATLEHQDWGTPWTEYRDTTDEDDDALLRFAQVFYFGE